MLRRPLWNQLISQEIPSPHLIPNKSTMEKDFMKRQVARMPCPHRKSPGPSAAWMRRCLAQSRPAIVPFFLPFAGLLPSFLLRFRRADGHGSRFRFLTIPGSPCQSSVRLGAPPCRIGNSAAPFPSGGTGLLRRDVHGPPGTASNGLHAAGGAGQGEGHTLPHPVFHKARRRSPPKTGRLETHGTGHQMNPACSRSLRRCFRSAAIREKRPAKAAAGFGKAGWNWASSSARHAGPTPQDFSTTCGESLAFPRTCLRRFYPRASWWKRTSCAPVGKPEGIAPGTWRRRPGALWAALAAALNAGFWSSA